MARRGLLAITATDELLGKSRCFLEGLSLTLHEDPIYPCLALAQMVDPFGVLLVHLDNPRRLVLHAVKVWERFQLAFHDGVGPRTCINREETDIRSGNLHLALAVLRLLSRALVPLRADS